MRVLRTHTSPLNDTVPAEKPITIRHLLTHTSGLAYGFDDNAVDRDMCSTGFPSLPYSAPWPGLVPGAPQHLTNISLGDFVQQLSAYPLLFQPGAHFSYGLNIDVCGALIEAISGQSLPEVAKQRLFDPLGMVDSGFFVPLEKQHRLAVNYLPPPKQLEDSKDRVCTEEVLGASGGGSLCGSTMDYLRFVMMLANEGEL